MTQQEQKPRVQETQSVQGFIANPQVFMNKDSETIIHRVSEEIRIEMPINLYKKILGLPFTKKEKSGLDTSASKRNVYGLVARPAIYLTKDGQYLIHRVLGVRISKHVNYYRKILGADFIPKTKSA